MISPADPSNNDDHVVGKIRTNNLVDRRIEMPFISRAKMLKRSWFNIADTPGCCCPYDAS